MACTEEAHSPEEAEDLAIAPEIVVSEEAPEAVAEEPLEVPVGEGTAAPAATDEAQSPAGSNKAPAEDSPDDQAAAPESPEAPNDPESAIKNRPDAAEAADPESPDANKSEAGEAEEGDAIAEVVGDAPAQDATAPESEAAAAEPHEAVKSSADEDDDATATDCAKATSPSKERPVVHHVQDISIEVVIDGDARSAKFFKLQHGETLAVGRFVQNQLVLEHRGISNKHCELKLGTDGSGAPALSIKDLSSNGTGLKPPNATGTALLQKGQDTPVPDGSVVSLPMSLKAKRGDESAPRRFFSVHFRTQREVDMAVEAARQERLAAAQASSPSSSPECDPPGKKRELPPRLPPSPPLQLPAVDSLLGAAVGNALSDSQASSPRPAAATAPPDKFSLPSSTQLRPKAPPKKPDASRLTQVGAVESAAERSPEAAVQKTSKKAASLQKSRSRNRSSSRSGGGGSKSRGRGRGRGKARKRSRSSSNRSRSRKRRRKRRKSKSQKKRKRRRSRSRSNRSQSNQDDEQTPAAGATTGVMGQTGNPMAGMQQSWGMGGWPQSYGMGMGYQQMQGAQGNAQPQMNVEVVKQQIYFMYQRFKPEKLPEFETIIKKYKGSENELLQAMYSKYVGGATASGMPSGSQ